MKLSDFIEQEMSTVLTEWETFATCLQPASLRLDPHALRDHAEQMLRAVVADLRTHQTDEAQAAKAHGQQMQARRQFPRTAAELHAVLRAGDGFSIEQLVSEYRALRASVLRLYGERHPPRPGTIDDIGRFNEAIHQAIAESVRYFAAEVDRWRHVFLGVLAHDMLGPLNAMLLTSQLIAKLSDDPPVAAATQRLLRSGARMKDLLDDLLGYNRTALGLGIPIRCQRADLQAICGDEIELRRTAHPGATLRFVCAGPVHGSWDPSRLRQLLGNLVSNAVQHGTPGAPIEIELTATDAQARLVVRNHGSTTTAEALESMFEPLRRSSADSRDEHRHLGLGLYVVREIARAHGGRVDVESGQGITAFAVQLPRHAAPAEGAPAVQAACIGPAATTTPSSSA